MKITRAPDIKKTHDYENISIQILKISDTSITNALAVLC